MDRLISIGMIDDNLMVRESAPLWFAAHSEVRVALTAGSVADYLAAGPAPGIVTLDLSLGNGTRPADNVRALVRAGHRVVIVTVVPNKEWIIETTEAGASAYLTSRAHSFGELVELVRALDRGELPTTPEHAFWLAQDDRTRRPRLTETEKVVLRLIGDGQLQEAVGRRLGGIKRSTVATHLANVRAKYREAGVSWEGAGSYRDWARGQLLDSDREDPTGRGEAS
ncbi:hypothetical protein ACIRBX_03550 [Kitasatospora sp. NPDC096147]|uniref:hypothetical protein n=1 Tax=Kitasatospora sp. NPDC096147 TaxID=3364093 RepID=UPI0037FF10C9